MNLVDDVLKKGNGKKQNNKRIQWVCLLCFI